MPFPGSRAYSKQRQRIEKGLCQACGKEKKMCSCKRFPKHRRQRVPDVLLSKRGKEIHKPDELALARAFRNQTLAITELMKENTPERIRERKLKEVEDRLDFLQ